jgi:hypothetical protein
VASCRADGQSEHLWTGDGQGNPETQDRGRDLVLKGRAGRESETREEVVKGERKKRKRTRRRRTRRRRRGESHQSPNLSES